MAELIDIQQVRIDPKYLTARVRIDEAAPLMTSEDLEATARVYRLLPHIVEHQCIGDAGDTFRDAMGNTELAHLLEHVTVELLAQTDLAGDTVAGRTWVDEVDDRTFEIELECPDDVLVSAALSCGVWILDWAYSGGEDPEPDVKAIVKGLVSLIGRIEGQGEDLVVDYVPEPVAGGELEDEGDEWLDEDELEPEEEPELEDASEPADEAELEDEPADEPAPEPEPEPARPLWTPAPTFERSRAPRTESRVPEVEAEVDQIMASIEGVPIVATSHEDFDEI